MHWGPRQEIYRVGPSRRSASIILRVWWKEGNIEIAYAGYFILLNLFIFLVCGILIPWPGLKPSPLHWKHRVLATGLPGKSLDHFKMWITGMGLGWIWGRRWWTSLEQILFSSERPTKGRQIISIQGREMRVLSLLERIKPLCPYKTAHDIICSYLVMKQRAFYENPLPTPCPWHYPCPPCHLMLAVLILVSSGSPSTHGSPETQLKNWKNLEANYLGNWGTKGSKTKWETWKAKQWHWNACDIQTGLLFSSSRVSKILSF